MNSDHIMAAKGDRILPQYLDDKQSYNEIDVPPTNLKSCPGKGHRFVFFVVGAILFYGAFKILGHDSSVQESLVRPHRIPPKVAEKIFLYVYNPMSSSATQ